MSETENVRRAEGSEQPKSSVSEGSPSDRERARLEQLAGALRLLYEGAVQVDYRQAELDCEALAAKLQEEIPRRELRGFTFRGIPRGGTVILGILSYALDLSATQLAESGGADAPEVWVDDCSLTGARFAQQMKLWSAPEVVFAHLYSPAPLRAEITRREERVRLCLAARDLKLLDSPEEVEARRDSPLNRAVQGERYWLGRAQRVSFAWSEPDLPFWNPATERIEDGWRFLAPHRCLKNRNLFRRIFPFPEGVERPLEGRWGLPEEVVYGSFEGVGWLCSLTSGQVVSLDGAAADMWRGLMAWGDEDVVLAGMGQMYEVEAATLEQDLRSFISELRERGFLERIDESG